MDNFHGSEDAFAGIRDFIIGGKAEDVFRFISGWTNHLVVDIAPRVSPAGYETVDEIAARVVAGSPRFQRNDNERGRITETLPRKFYLGSHEVKTTKADTSAAESTT
jgi:hypothetical protein